MIIFLDSLIFAAYYYGLVIIFCRFLLFFLGFFIIFCRYLSFFLGFFIIFLIGFFNRVLF